MNIGLRISTYYEILLSDSPNSGKDVSILTDSDLVDQDKRAEDIRLGSELFRCST